MSINISIGSVDGLDRRLDKMEDNLCYAIEALQDQDEGFRSALETEVNKFFYWDKCRVEKTAPGVYLVEMAWRDNSSKRQKDLLASLQSNSFVLGVLAPLLKKTVTFG